MELSVVLPTYNSNALTQKSLRDLLEYLSKWCPSYEVIVVDDGSRMEERLDKGQVPNGVRVIQFEKNTGKGAAVKAGMLEARGEVCVFTDIDLPYDLSAIQFSYQLIKEKGLHFVAGDRSLPQSHYVVHAPLYRRIASKVFSKCITLFIIGGIFDSQCGLKAFSSVLTKSLFPLLTVDRFSFDVEIYYLILKYNILIRRIPVCLVNSDVSTVNIVKHAFKMSSEVVCIPFNWYTGKYASSSMSDFMDLPYWKKSPERKIS